MRLAFLNGSRLRSGALARWFLIISTFALLIPCPIRGGTVYVVLGSDTAVWNAPGGIAVANFRNHFDPTLFTSPETNAFKSIDPVFRSQFVDSFGQSLKMTWWLLVGSVYGQSDNLDVPVPNLMPLYLMRKYHGKTLQELGDEVTLHYHTFLWSDYNQDGVFYWNEAQTFHECRDDWDLALAQSLVEEEVFPVSFRSGWHYMDNEWQQTLNQLLPFNMDDDSPNRKAWSTNEPTFNVLDWSQATTEFVPFQPSATNYQVGGGGPGWNVHSVKFVNVTQALMNRTFAQAAADTDQVVSLWGHLAESDFVPEIAKMHGFIQTAAGLHPGVNFRYCTAVEAMQRWLGTIRESPPVLSVDQGVDQDRLTLKLSSSKNLFQPHPFVAIKDIFQRYSIQDCLPAGSNSWVINASVPQSQIAKIGIAATDLAGNLTTQLIRVLPDDLYLDNLDAEYHESEGQWTNHLPAAWGTDCRVALLRSNGVARVSWALPVVAEGSYNILVQFPDVAKLSTNVAFAIKAGEGILLTNTFQGSITPKTWIHLGEPFLNPATSNSLELTFRGEHGSDTFAAADVVRVTPLPVAPAGAISAVLVDPADTTASVTWTSSQPSSDHLRYGAEASLGEFSPTNSVPDTSHIVTLRGLTPARLYYAQINSEADGLKSVYELIFKTATNTPPMKLNVSSARGAITLFWNGDGNLLQRTENLKSSSTQWVSLSTNTTSPYSLTATNRAFYRLVH